MIKKVFIGGNGGSGTRVLSMILEQVGYNLGNNIDITTKDYLPWLVPIWECWDKNNCSLKIEEKEPSAIKHGQLMFIIPQLKKANPNSKFILIMRNGIDNILNYTFKWENTFCKDLVIQGTELERKMSAWTESYKIALKNADHVVKLEEMCVDPAKEIGRLFKFLNIKKDPQDFVSIVEIPMSIGRRDELTVKIRKKLFKIGEEIMNKFGYSF